MKSAYIFTLGLLMNIATSAAEPAFNIVGITLRTSNAAAFADGTIGALWQRFFAEAISSKITNKTDTTLLALYYDFETNRDGMYTLLLGHRVDSLQQIPDGMTGIQVPAQKTVIFTTPQGPVTPGIVQTWQEIWSLEDQQKLSRAYGFEYELYDERSYDQNNGVAEIHISVTE
jgi:predicted transcriptional regulator YdeE